MSVLMSKRMYVETSRSGVKEVRDFFIFFLIGNTWRFVSVLILYGRMSVTECS